MHNTSLSQWAMFLRTQSWALGNVVEMGIVRSGSWGGCDQITWYEISKLSSSNYPRFRTRGQEAGGAVSCMCYLEERLSTMVGNSNLFTSHHAHTNQTYV